MKKLVKQYLNALLDDYEILCIRVNNPQIESASFFAICEQMDEVNAEVGRVNA